jgi:predicted RND superfamily exporter protein
MALVTDLVGFGTLILLPIGMIQELGITASIGVAFKIVTNLIMLPLAASYARYNESFAARAQSAISYRQNLMGFFGKLARPREAVITLSVSAVLFIGAVYLASERHVGDLHAGAPELRPEARFNQDINEITKRYNVTTDVLVVITEASFTGGVNPCRSTYVMDAQNNLHWYLENIPGVSKVISLSSIAKRALSGYAEGNLKWSYLPRNEQALGFATSVVDPSTGLINEQCSIMPIYVFTEDHKATTLNTVISSIEEYNEKFRELDDTITFKTLIAKPSDGTDVIPAVDSLGGEETNIEDLLNIDNPKIFTDDEFTDFGYENGFNTRNIMLGPGLINYYRDIDSFDDNVNYMVKDIKQSEISFKEFFNNNPEFESIIFESDEIKNRLASGSVGIQYATNEVIEKGELPMMIIVYIVIFILVFVTYLDWRATICCTVPLTFATVLGYAFMDLAQIGLKVSTLPVMVLAVGVGVDYAFYIYNRTQTRLKEGMNITEAFEHTFANTGAAVVFTAITLAIGVSTWSFSALKFQADMGSLLTFMFLINMVCAMTTLPALAVVLDKLFPRKITSE